MSELPKSHVKFRRILDECMRRSLEVENQRDAETSSYCRNRNSCCLMILVVIRRYKFN